MYRLALPHWGATTVVYIVTAPMALTSSLNMSYLRHSRPENTFSDPDTKTISHSVLADNAEHIVSYDGTGQHTKDGAGAAACGLAALNFATTVFSIEQGGLKDVALLQAVLARECIEVRLLCQCQTTRIGLGT
jgi:hypothetical protein